jgi:hypothetical protein
MPSKESLAAAKEISLKLVSDDETWMSKEVDCAAAIIDRAFAEKLKAAQGLADSLWEMLNQYGGRTESGWRKRLHDSTREAINKWK